VNDGGGGADPATPSGLPVGDLPFTGPPTVDLVPPASALAVGAHPDDIEFGCGATLAKWAAAGCRVEYLVLTDGSKGSWDESADLDRLIEERAAESRAAAAVIQGAAGASGEGGGEGGGASGAGAGGRVHFLGRVDGELVDGPAERREVARLIRTLRPEALLGHDPWRRYRLHPDHRVAGFLTIGALVAARDPHFFPELGVAPHRPGVLLLWEADQPNHVESVGGFEEAKIAALLCHGSQAESTFGIGPADDGASAEDEFASKVRRQLAAHGSLAGLPTGEAFHLMRP
jgi:LmbE family N-acetylglucosaminyl deacetylase